MTVPLLNRLLQQLQKSGEEGVLDIAEIFGEREAIQDYPAFIQAIAAPERDAKSAEAGFSEFNSIFSIRGWHSSIRIRDDELRRLQTPTTVIWGKGDTLVDQMRSAVGSTPSPTSD